MRRIAIIALTLAFSVSAFAGANAEDLLAVYDQARAADPALAGSRAQAGVQQELAVQARAVLLPQWSANASSTRNQPGSENGSAVSSTISQTVFDLASLRRWDAAQSMASAQDAAVRAAEQDLCERVASAYFGVLSAQATLRTAKANADALKQQVEQAEVRFKAGMSASVDVEFIRTYQQLSLGTVEQARQSLADAREALAQITGREPGPLAPLAKDFAAVPPEPNLGASWVARAMDASPTLRAQALAVTSSEQSMAAARAGHLPTLSFGVTGQRQHGYNAIDPGRTDTQLGLTLNIPIFAGGAVQSQVRQASWQREMAREQLEAARRAVTRDVLAQFRAVSSSLMQIEAGRSAVEAADRAVESIRAGFALGTRSITDLLLAIQNQAAAQNAFEQARHSYVLATLLLQGAVGGLDADALAHANQLLKPE